MRAMPPLKAASLLVQEDLILMRRGDNGWRLAAGSLCFPSSWTLTEKFGRPLQEIHRPVPGFGPDTRNNELINRMFDRLHQPVLRFNWSIQAGDALYHPLSHEGRVERAETRPSRFGDADLNAAAFIRVERQTLRKLPAKRRYPLHDPHLSRPARLDRAPSGPAETGGQFCGAAKRSGYRATRLQGADCRPG